MRELNSSESCRPVIFIFLAFCLFLVQGLRAEQKFWAPSNTPKSHYKIEAKIDLKSRTVEGIEKILIHNTSSSPMSLFALDWTISEFRSVTVEMKGKPLSPLNAGKGSIVTPPIVYQFPQPVSPGGKVELDVKFSLGGLPDAEAKEVKLVEWYPRLWWDGLETHDSFEVKLDIPSGYALAASGRLNKKTGFYENKGVRNFGIYLGKEMKTEKREVDGVLITSIFTEEGAECARLCLDTAVDVITFYKRWLGFYPFNFLSIVPGGPQPWGGYPFASGIVVIHGQEKFKSAALLHWKWITAHEIGHQYWGEYVLDGDEPSWLWIGMGIYADREYTLFRNIGMDKHLGLMNRYLDGVKKRFDTTVDIPPAQLKKINFDHNNVVIHGKGYSIISALELVLGKGAFEKIYKRCLKDYAGRRLGYKEFWRVCEEESGETLNWFFDSWVRSNSYLCYRVTAQDSSLSDGKYVSRVELGSLGTMEMPVPVKAVFEDGTSQVRLSNRIFKVNTLVFESKSKLKEVVLDPEHKLAMLTEPLPVLPEDLADAISELPWSGAGEKALENFEKAKEMKITEPRLWFKLGLTLFDGGYYRESFDAFQKLTELKPSELELFSALVWMGHLKDLTGSREEAVKYYTEALKHDAGETMRHDQYGLQINRAWVEERLKTPFQWGKKSK